MLYTEKAYIFLAASNTSKAPGRRAKKGGLFWS